MAESPFFHTGRVEVKSASAQKRPRRCYNVSLFLPMRIVLISTYELGRQPFGLASPAAWLRHDGHQVTCLDLSRQELDEAAIREAELIAFYIPMHTATRLAVALLEPVRALNQRAAICFYGLYAPVNEAYLRRLGVDAILGGEFEEVLARLAKRLGKTKESDEQAEAASPERQIEPVISLARQNFIVPDRTGLVRLERYARLLLPDGRRAVVGSTEASRGCKHRCRHCPVTPVYNGAFRVVQREVVLEDIRRQVAAGAEHITFGDPDFWNGPRHADEIVRALHREFPRLTYDATIKVEHLLKHRKQLETLRETGCLFVTTAAESVDDAVLEKLEKGHTRADFVEVVRLFREAGLTLQPTFVPFTPWTTLEGYAELLETIEGLGLEENVAPVQLSIRLLIPAGSRLLELTELRPALETFDETSLVYPWRHHDEQVDRLQRRVEELVKEGQAQGLSRRGIFGRVCEAASEAGRRVTRKRVGSGANGGGRKDAPLPARATIPYLTEPWYC